MLSDHRPPWVLDLLWGFCLLKGSFSSPLSLSAAHGGTAFNCILIIECGQTYAICKASWDNVDVMWRYINNIDLIWWCHKIWQQIFKALFQKNLHKGSSAKMLISARPQSLSKLSLPSANVFDSHKQQTFSFTAFLMWWYSAFLSENVWGVRSSPHTDSAFTPALCSPVEWNLSVFPHVLRLVCAGVTAAGEFGVSSDQTSAQRPGWRGGLCPLPNQLCCGSSVVRTWSDLCLR